MMILTSVGILPLVLMSLPETIILNRATKSLTYIKWLVVDRKLPNKDMFTVIDLGNNAARFWFVEWACKLATYL
jgi:hypothetical protein